VFAECFEAFRKFLPDVRLHIIDGSEVGHPCREYIKTLASQNTVIDLIGHNIGHGRGMNRGLSRCSGEYVLLFDSDAIMIDNPVPKMLQAMTPETYAVGEIFKIGLTGLHRDPPTVPYVRPYFMLLNRALYYQHSPFVHHGSPCIRPMREIFDAGRSDELLRHVDLIPQYIRHDWGATRKMNVKRGLRETPMNWDDPKPKNENAI